MSFTVTNSGTNSSGAQSCVLTLSIPAHSKVAVVAMGTVGAGLTGAHGTCVDSNSVSYLTGNAFADVGDGWQADTFYTLDSGSAATTLTYTLPAGPTQFFNSQLVAWIFTATGTVTVGGSAALTYPSNAPTSTDGVTTGALAVSTADGIVFGAAWDATAADLSPGTGFTSDGTGFSGKTVFEHMAVTGNHAATWTCSVLNDSVVLAGLSFQITPAVLLQANARAAPPMLGSKKLGPLGLAGFAKNARFIAPTVNLLGNIPSQSYTQNTGTQTLNTAAFFVNATSYAISPALPAGATFNTSTGVISWNTATVALGSYGPFTVTATNNMGSTPSNAFTLAEVVPPVPSLWGGSLTIIPGLQP